MCLPPDHAPRKRGRPRNARNLSQPWVEELKKLHSKGWTDREMAEGRDHWKTGEEQPGLPGGPWTRKSVAYWRGKLGLKRNPPRWERRRETVADRLRTARLIRAGAWRRLPQVADRGLTRHELLILDALDDHRTTYHGDSRPMTRPQLRRAISEFLPRGEALPRRSAVLDERPGRALARLLALGLVRASVVSVTPGVVRRYYRLPDGVTRLEAINGRQEPTRVEREQRRLGVR